MNFNFSQSRLYKFWWFVREREQVRLRKALDIRHVPAQDDTISRYHFCNVDREDDRVTRWIRLFVRDRFAPSTPLHEIVFRLLVARVFNEPQSLAQLVWAASANDMIRVIRQLRKAQIPVYRGVYMIVPHNSTESTDTYYPRLLFRIRKALRQDQRIREQGDVLAPMLETVAAVLLDQPDIGPFLANQVCTDLRYVPAISWQWADTATFVLPGPGTKRGLNRLLGLPLSRQLPDGHATSLILKLRRTNAVVPKSMFYDPNNLANCLCEFDKYCRVRERPASARVRVYAPTL